MGVEGLICITFGLRSKRIQTPELPQRPPLPPPRRLASMPCAASRRRPSQPEVHSQGRHTPALPLLPSFCSSISPSHLQSSLPGTAAGHGEAQLPPPSIRLVRASICSGAEAFLADLTISLTSQVFHINPAFNAAPMIAEWAGKGHINLVHQLLP